MISKNSFLVNLLENTKRQIWLMVVSILTFTVAIPIFMAMEFSVISQRKVLIEQMKVQENLYRFAAEIYGKSNIVLLVFAAMFALAAGVQGFSYLYDRSKIDFYHSKPVKTSTRFLTIWVNGLLAWLIPYMAGMLINLVLFASHDILDVALIQTMGQHLLVATGLYLCMYHLAILAVMLTGKGIVTCLGIFVFLLYEYCVRLLLTSFCSYFYPFFYLAKDNHWEAPVLSPVTYLGYYQDGTWHLFTAMTALLLFAAGVLVISFWCYKKRPSEMAGSAMVFGITKPIIRIGISVPVALAAGLVTCSIVDYSPQNKVGSPLFPLLIGGLVLIVVSCLIQVIYEADIRAVFHKKTQIFISFVIAMGIALLFRYDLSGYNTHLPKEDAIDYASLVTGTDERYVSNFLTEDGKWTDKESYVYENMKLTGKEAETVYDLAKHSMELYQEQKEKNFADEYAYRYAVFYFHQKNGTVFCRQIPVAVREEQTISYLKQIEDSEEFILANEPALTNALCEFLNQNTGKVEAKWGNEIYEEELSRKQVRELLEYYRMDVLQGNYEMQSEEIPVGRIYLFADDLAEGYYGRSFSVEIYPSCQNAICYLQENGFETTQYVDPSDVEKIIVTRYGYEDAAYEDGVEDYYLGNVFYEERVVTAAEEISCTYTEQEQMNEILEGCYPYSLEWDFWYCEDITEENYSVEVFFKEGSEPYEENGYSANMELLKGRIPDFVTQDLDMSR